MRKWYTYIIMLATVLFGSCNLEDTLFPEQECENGKKDVNVRLILSMMGGDGVSRALTDYPTSEDYLDEEPLGNEYYINPYDVEVLIFTCGDKPENSYFVERATMVRASKTEYYKYQLDGTLSEIEAETPYRIVVLANMHGSCYTTGGMPLTKGQTTMKTYLESLKYTGYTTSFTTRMIEENSTERIPMWGATASYLKDGAMISLDLLRAMSKVKVKMPKNLGKELSAVTLEYANDGGYVTPLLTENGNESTTGNPYGVSAITNNSGTKTIEGGKTQRVRTTRIPDDVEPIKGITENENILNFSKVNNTNENKYNEYVIYVPEYKNLNLKDGKKQARMKLAIGDKEYELEFKDYSANNTGYFDIIRNYYYQYEITSVGKTLGFNADIYSWGSATKVVEIIVEDFHWLYVKDKVLYMNNVNQIKTTFDSSTDDLFYTISDVKVYNTSTAWNDTNGKINSVTIDKSLKGDITINSDIPDNFVGKEFKVTVSSATSGKSETIQVYQFPPLYLTLQQNSQGVDAQHGQTNSSVYEITTLLADLSWLPESGENLELDENFPSGYSHEGTLNQRKTAGTSTINFLKNCKFGYPQTEAIHYDQVTSTIYNEDIKVYNIDANTTVETSENGNLISPHFILASQGGANSITDYNYAKQNCAGYSEIVKNADGTTTTYGKGTWRVPTKGELMLIDLLQNITKSQVKRILEGEKYIYAKNPTDNDYVMMDRRVDNTHAVRCVRDIK